jgi:hypothetical protein
VIKWVDELIWTGQLHYLAKYTTSRMEWPLYKNTNEQGRKAIVLRPRWSQERLLEVVRTLERGNSWELRLAVILGLVGILGFTKREITSVTFEHLSAVKKKGVAKGSWFWAVVKEWEFMLRLFNRVALGVVLRELGRDGKVKGKWTPRMDRMLRMVAVAVERTGSKDRWVFKDVELAGVENRRVVIEVVRELDRKMWIPERWDENAGK